MVYQEKMRKVLTNENLFVLDGHDKDGESLESEGSEESEAEDDAALDSDENEGVESEESNDDEAGSDDEDGEEAEETEDTGVAEPKKKRAKIIHAEVSEEEKEVTAWLKI